MTADANPRTLNMVPAGLRGTHQDPFGDESGALLIMDGALMADCVPH